MIVNTGSRTDIPVFYSEWFYQRIKEGYVLVRNPYYPQQVSKIYLDPAVVDVLVFCTKNPAPMLDRLAEISAFSQYWFVTITPYGREIEPNVPDKEKVMEDFIRLSRQVGTKSIGWRYDPVFLNDTYTMDYHSRTFEKMAAKLAGYTTQCVVSFIDLYEKTKRNFPQVQSVKKEEQEILTQRFVEIGRTYGMRISLCCEEKSLARFGAEVSGCMTQEVLERAIGCRLQVPAGKKAVRPQCECLLGSDIGMYNTCDHACLYCYANYDRQTVVQNMEQHDPLSPFLVGHGRANDIVKEGKQQSWRDGQMDIFQFL